MNQHAVQLGKTSHDEGLGDLFFKSAHLNKITDVQCGQCLDGACIAGLRAFADRYAELLERDSTALCSPRQATSVAGEAAPTKKSNGKRVLLIAMLSGGTMNQVTQRLLDVCM